MKKLQFLILIGILTISISCGQQKRYVSYKVKDGETMRDIAKRLDMNSKDLMRLNPDVGKRPLPNTIIVIPNPKVKNGDSSSTSKEGNYAIIEEKSKDELKRPSDKNNEPVLKKKTITKYETHIVKAGETVYRITKQYNISKKDLIKLNPDHPELISNQLSIGQIVKVKAIEETVVVNQKEIENQYVTHIVKSKETVYSITRFYNISKDDLLQLNPDFPTIKDNQLSVGQILKIKRIDEVKEDESLIFYRDSIQENSTINLALLLPFVIEKNDTLAAKKIFENRLANFVTDFYMGAEIAIDSLKKQGVTVNTDIFDTGARGNNISQIVENDVLNDRDIIIGPFYSEKVSKVAKATGGIVVFPHYSKNQDELSMSKIIKSAPNKTLYANYLTTYLSRVFNGEKIFVVGDDTTESNKTMNAISTSLKKNDSITEVVELKPEKGYIKRERFTDKMNEKQHNWVIIASEDKVTTKDVLNSMIGLPDDITVQVFTTHKNKIYEDIDNNKLANINFTYVSNTYLDDNSEDVNVFYKKFKKRNNTLPSNYAIRGFDVTYDILMRYASGNDVSKTFKEGISLRVENKFDYHKKMFGAAENRGLFIIKYNSDLSLQRLK
ncbi:LysM peptidoglycan-binding domain-containing protein [Tenacibaculum sp. C7A-26P2]|uniref:LysM peptidoglycan-binding domain-containing protein n=1 Tax=Tenacibaculum sp. C7A-26P2 TaxID=3447504 RepID=UPI003F86C2EC